MADPLKFSMGAYQIAAGAHQTVLHGHLGARLAQLAAMLTVINGEGQQTFASWSDEVQGNYIWACGSLASECEELSRALKVAPEPAEA